MIHNYLKIAFRNLVKNKVYSFINIGGLAVGMAVVILIALFVHDEYNYDRFHPNFNQIYRVTENQKQSDGNHLIAVTPSPLAAALKNDFSEIDKTVRIGQWSGLLQGNGKNLEPDRILIVDQSLFDVFEFPLVIGSPKSVFNNPDEVVITEKSAEFFFGEDWNKKDILGTALVLNSTDKLSLKLVGVVKNMPTNSHIQADVFLPFKFVEKYDEWSQKWNSNNYHTYLKINNKTTLATFEKKIAGYLKKYETGTETVLGLQPLSTIYLESKFDFQTDWGKRSDIFYVYLFITVGLIVLLIAVFNFINLSTAHATQRVKEVGVRKTIGAGRGSLIYQFLLEASLVVVLAVVIALIITNQLLPVLNELSDKTLVIPIYTSGFWAILVFFSISITLLSGLYPAFVLSSYQPAKVLKGFFTINAGKYFRQSLVVGQFTLSIILIVSTFVIFRQLTFMQNKSLGFDKEHLLYVKLKGNLKQNAVIFKNEVAKIAGVESVSTTTNNLVNVANSSNIEWEGQPPKDEFSITQMNIDPDFVRTVGAKLVAGRNFSAAMPTDTSDKMGVYLINETAAKRMGWTPEKALGKKVKFWGFEGNIIGVLKDFHFRPLSEEINPFIFRNRPKEFYFNLLIKTKSNQVPQLLASLTALYKKYEPDYPLNYGFVNQDLDRQYKNEQRTGQIVFIFSVLAILISCMGLYGLVMFTTQLRIKEIGVRKVLGASIGNIMALLSKDFLKLILLACTAAFPLGYWLMNTWLQDFKYRLEIGWEVFIGVGLLVVLVTLFTISWQSFKAAVVNPVKSLKTE